MSYTPYPLRTDFTGITVCVTGAGAGIGKAAAMAFHALGAKVVITGRRADRLETLKASVKEPERFHCVAFDVSNKEKVAEAFKNVPADFAEIDILLNNAGLALGRESVDQGSLNDWEVMVDTNIKGVLYVTHALLPGMIERNRGYIINLGSVAGSYPYPGGNVYGATKAFVELFSLNMRADLIGKAIRVTNIEPGMVETDFSLVRFKGDKERASSVYAGTTPLTAEDIAQTILWCASLPEHVNINRMEIMPVTQAFNPFNIARNQ